MTKQQAQSERCARRVSARFWEWWDATMLDEIHQTTLGEPERSPEWWGEKFLELRNMAERETVEGFEL